MKSTNYGIFPLPIDKLSTDRATDLLFDSLKFSGNFAKKNAKDLIFGDYHSRLQVAFQAFNNHPKGKQQSDLPQTLEEVDAKRDKAYKGFALAVDSATFYESKELSAAANLLAQALKENKVNIYAGYATESGQIQRLLDVLKAQVYQDALTRLNLLSRLVDLTNAQTAFKQVYDQRTDQEAKLVVGQNQELKTQALAIYRDMVDYVAAIAHSPVAAPVYPELLAQLNSVRKAIAADKRKSKAKESRKAKDATTSQETPEPSGTE